MRGKLISANFRGQPAAVLARVGISAVGGTGGRQDRDRGRAGAAPPRRGGRAALAVGETGILLHPPLPSVGVSMWTERGVSAK